MQNTAYATPSARGSRAAQLPRTSFLVRAKPIVARHKADLGITVVIERPSIELASRWNTKPTEEAAILLKPMSDEYAKATGQSVDFSSALSNKALFVRFSQSPPNSRENCAMLSLLLPATTVDADPKTPFGDVFRWLTDPQPSGPTHGDRLLRDALNGHVQNTFMMAGLPQAASGRDFTFVIPDLRCVLPTIPNVASLIRDIVTSPPDPSSRIFVEDSHVEVDWYHSENGNYVGLYVRGRTVLTHTEDRLRRCSDRFGVNLALALEGLPEEVRHNFPTKLALMAVPNRQADTAITSKKAEVKAQQVAAAQAAKDAEAQRRQAQSQKDRLAEQERQAAQQAELDLAAQKAAEEEALLAEGIRLRQAAEQEIQAFREKAQPLRTRQNNITLRLETSSNMDTATIDTTVRDEVQLLHDEIETLRSAIHAFDPDAKHGLLLEFDWDPPNFRNFTDLLTQLKKRVADWENVTNPKQKKSKNTSTSNSG